MSPGESDHVSPQNEVVQTIQAPMSSIVPAETVSLLKSSSPTYLHGSTPTGESPNDGSRDPQTAESTSEATGSTQKSDVEHNSLSTQEPQPHTRIPPAVPVTLDVTSSTDSECEDRDGPGSARDVSKNGQNAGGRLNTGHQRSINNARITQKQGATGFSNQADLIPDRGLKNRVSQEEQAPKPGAAENEPRPSEEFAGQEEPRPEIDNIIGQFEGKPNSEEAIVVQPPSGSTLPVFQYPPRTSSLEHYQRGSTLGGNATDETNSAHSPSASGDPEKTSLSRTSTVSQPPPPQPDPEPDLPFDFHRFLEQLRHRTADPVAKFLRSFLQEFGKKQWMVHEQVKIISDFLAFIGNRMAQCEVWHNVSEAEFDNAKEGMEKLVMNRLYNQTFSPEIPIAEPSKTRRKGTNFSLGPGRKGQHQEDVERDDVLAQKVRIYGWVREEHLDIKPFGDKGRRFLVLAQKGMYRLGVRASHC